MSPEDERNIGDLISLRARALVVLLLPLTTAQVWTSLRILNREVLFIIFFFFCKCKRVFIVCTFHFIPFCLPLYSCGNM